MMSPSAKKIPEATALYQEWLEKLPELARRTVGMLDPEQLENIKRLVKKSRRVFCTGSGSSVATAWYLAATLCSYGGISSSFVGTSQIVALQSLSAGDLVILVSQGFNRSDSAIIMQTARSRGASTVVLTAYPDAITSDGIVRFVPLANDERLFCRPCGAVTSLIAGIAIAARCLDLPFSGDELCAAVGSQCGRWESGRTHEQVADTLREASLIIVLGSGELQPALHNVALALREGAGKIAEYYEIEYYAHGQYAPHFRHQDSGGNVVYLLGQSMADRVSSRAVERILPLLHGTRAAYEIYSARGAVPGALVSLLSAANQVVRAIILGSGYDMNHPRGKEENRGFQLVEASYYE